MSTKKKPTHASAASKTPLILESYFNSPERLERAKLIQTLLPWISLENFRSGIAKDSDWSFLQYWLYYSEALVSLHDTSEPSERIELAANVGYGIQALYAAGRRYNESKYTMMTMTPEERDSVRIGLLIGDALKEVTDEKYLLVVGRHIQKVLSIPAKGK